MNTNTDTMSSSTDYTNTATGLASKKILLWIAMGSMIMLFAGLTSAYLVRKAEGNWLEFDLPTVFTFSSAAILLSSISMNQVLVFGRRNNIANMRRMLLVTLGLGLAFVILQFSGWKELVGLGVFFSGKSANSSGSFLYVLTGLHLAHLAGGLIALLYCIFDSFRAATRFGPKNILSLELTAIFWHFLTILWIYLFLFLLIVR